jgi:hypothetical protein
MILGISGKDEEDQRNWHKTSEEVASMHGSRSENESFLPKIIVHRNIGSVSTNRRSAILTRLQAATLRIG